MQGSATPLTQIPHRAEVQSLALVRSAEGSAEGGTLLGSVDSFGRAIVAEVSTGDAGAVSVKAQYELTPPVVEGKQSSNQEDRRVVLR